MFGKTLEDDAETEDGSTTRPASSPSRSRPRRSSRSRDDRRVEALVETGVPADPKQVKFKRIGRETTTSKKITAPPEPVEAGAEEQADEIAEAEDEADVAAVKPAAPAKKRATPKEAGGKPKPAVLVGAGAVALLGAVGAAALFMRGGGEFRYRRPSMRRAPMLAATPTSFCGNPAANAAGDRERRWQRAQNAVATPPPAGSRAARTRGAAQGSRRKTAAAEAGWPRCRKPQAKAAAAQKAGAAASYENQTGKAATSGSHHRRFQPSQWRRLVGQAVAILRRSSTARAAWPSRSCAPATAPTSQLARSYDANLKTLRDSMRGVNSDKEADRLIKQASQTRAYVQFLVSSRNSFDRLVLAFRVRPRGGTLAIAAAGDRCSTGHARPRCRCSDFMA